jgi:hypothetical protein
MALPTHTASHGAATGSARAKGDPRALWAARGLLLACAALLAAVPALEIGKQGAAAEVVPLPRAADLMEWAEDAAAAGAWLAARFVPIGVLAVLSLPPRRRRLRRAVFVALPGAALALTLTLAVLGVQPGPSWTLPASTALVLPCLGALFGVAAGLAWVRGWRARLWFLPKLALGVVVGAGAVVALAALALEHEPLDIQAGAPTSADKRRLHALFRDANPAEIPAGETRTLRLSQRDVAQLLAWGLPMTRTDARASLALGTGEAFAAASVRLPRIRRYLNLSAGGTLEIERGRLHVAARELQVGRVALPWPLPGALGALAGALAREEPRIKAVVSGIERLELTPESLSVSYGRTTLPPGFIADLFGGDRTAAELAPAVRVYVERLVSRADGLPRGAERFPACVEAVFALARERAIQGPALPENQAAILALGIVLGHTRVEALLGGVLDDELRARARRAGRDVALRGRRDWTQHFCVSASLAVVSTDALSDAAGLLKEELDSDGGSGFSFGDLLADRAGTRFASLATQDETAARNLQLRLARGFRVDDFFPSAQGLPEGLTDAQLRSRYGGVGGPGYARLAAEIESRLDACRAYRETPAAAR